MITLAVAKGSLNDCAINYISLPLILLQTNFSLCPSFSMGLGVNFFSVAPGAPQVFHQSSQMPCFARQHTLLFLSPKLVISSYFPKTSSFHGQVIPKRKNCLVFLLSGNIISLVHLYLPLFVVLVFIDTF